MNSALTIIFWLLVAFILGYLLRYLWTRAAGHQFGRLRFWVLPLFLIWGGLSTWWYSCEIKNECGAYEFAEAPMIEPAAGPEPLAETAIDEPPVQPAQSAQPVEDALPDEEPIEVAQLAPPPPSWPLYFDWEAPTALTGPGFDRLKQGLVADLGPGERLKITGLYNPEETNTSNFANLGLARAAATRDLLSGLIPAEQIDIDAEVYVSDAWNAGEPFELARFETLAAPPLVLNETVYFGLNSITPEEGITLDRELVARINAEKPNIRLIGHTDSLGDREYNRLLGQKRALAVRSLLVEQGVDPALIILATEGELKPVESNATSGGKQKNRRVDIQLDASGR